MKDECFEKLIKYITDADVFCHSPDFLDTSFCVYNKYKMGIMKINLTLTKESVDSAFPFLLKDLSSITITKFLISRKIDVQKVMNAEQLNRLYEILLTKVEVLNTKVTKDIQNDENKNLCKFCKML